MNASMTKKDLFRTLFMGFIFYTVSETRYLHSFPTRRSPDLLEQRVLPEPHRGPHALLEPIDDGGDRRGADERDGRPEHDRSEEQTSELQSHSDLICRLLLGKKKENEGR